LLAAKSRLSRQAGKCNGKNVKITAKEACDFRAAELKTKILLSAFKEAEKAQGLPPLITSTLQQEAFRRFKFP